MIPDSNERRGRPAFVLLALFLVLTLAPAPTRAGDPLPPKVVINIPEIPAAEVVFFRKLVVETCHRLKIELQLTVHPLARSLFEMEHGNLDGEGPRNPTVEKNLTNIIRVPEIFFVNELTAFARDPNIRLAGWDSLKSHRVAYVRGWKIYENNVKGVKNLEILESEVALFKFLAADRTDLALAAKILGLQIIRDLGLEGIVVVEPPLVIKNMYLYLNEKHTALASAMAATLKEMKSDGTYRKLYEETIGPLP